MMLITRRSAGQLMDRTAEVLPAKAALSAQDRLDHTSPEQARAWRQLPPIGTLPRDSQPATAARYTRLSDNPVEVPAGAVGQHLAAAMTGETVKFVLLRRIGG